MNKKKIEKIITILAGIIFLTSLIMYFNTTTKYATIKGENFTIPKQEGAYYYER